MDGKLREANERFLVGDHISDRELLDLLAFYEDLAPKLAVLEGKFQLCWGEVNRRRNNLEDYKRARGLE